MAGSLASGIAGQLALPSGLAGNLIGRAMDLANRRCNQQALDLLAPRDGERILDVGCGTGAALASVARRARCSLSGIDPSSTMISAARRRLGPGVKLNVTTIEDMARPAAGLDAVLALNVLYFADIDGRMVSAIYRALKPGGRLVAYVTDRATMEGWSFTRAGRHRLFDADLLAALLHQGGFARDSITLHPCSAGPGVKGLLACARR